MKTQRTSMTTKWWLVAALVLITTLLPRVGIAESTTDLSEQLIQAAVHGNLAQVRTLLDKGADVNARDNKGRTALMWAAAKGHMKVTKRLLEKGADVQTKDNFGFTALKRAQGFGHKEIVELLKAHGAKE